MTWDPDQRVRPLGPGDVPTPSPGPRRGLFLAIIAAAGVAIGFLIGAYASGSSITAPSDDAASATAPDLAGDPDPTTTTTAPPPTTVTTLPPTLGDLVPSFDGTLAFAADDERPVVATWPDSAPDPLVRDLPAGTVAVGWNSAGSAAAALAESDFGSSLFIDDGSGYRPLALTVSSFRWHPTDPTQLAWTAPDPGGGTAIYLGRFSGGLPLIEPIVTGLSSDTSHSLAAFGTWGFAIDEALLDGGDRSLATYDRTGRLVARAEYAIVAERDDGVLVVTDAPAGDPVPLYLTGMDLAAQIPISWSIGTTPATWSRNGRFLMAVVPGPAGSAVELFLPDFVIASPVPGDDEGQITGRVVRYRIDTPAGRPLGWSSDDRFVLIYSDTLQLDGGRGPGLLVVDILDKSTHPFPVGGSLLGAALLP